MDIVSRTAELLRDGETFCLATVLASAEELLPPGAKFLVRRDGSFEGAESLAGSELLEQLRTAAVEGLARRKRRTVEVRPGLNVFFDVLSAEAKLLLCGAGHIALSLARFARELGFSVTVLDDRPDFAHPSRFPGCEVVAEDFVTALRRMPLGPSAHVVVITRGHEHDTECLIEVLRKETAYVGLIGSRRRVRFVLELLGREGIPQGRLDQLFTPIGLPIGAESPEEIALSIAAELVSVRRRGPAETQALREPQRRAP
jgi:xanthine dehydrogenase accessory factor